MVRRGLVAAVTSVLLGAAVGEPPGSCPAGRACGRAAEQEEDVSLLQRAETITKVDLDEYAAVGYAEDPAGNVCDEVGAHAWLSESGINNILQKIFPALSDEAVQVFDIPENTGNQNGWYYNASGATLLHYDIDVPTIELKDGAVINFQIAKFLIDLKLHYDVRGTEWWNSFLSAAGTLRIELKLTDMINGTLGVKINSDNKPVLNLDLGEVKFKLGGFVAEGSIFDGLIEFLVAIFQEKVEEYINGWAVDMLEKAVNVYLNKLIADIKFSIPLPFGGGSSDLAPCYVEVGDKVLGFGLRGAIVDDADPKKVAYKGAPTKLRNAPPKTLLDGGAMLALEMAPYMINTGMALLQTKGVLDTVVRQSDLSSGSKLRFDVAKARQIVPQLAAPRSAESLFMVHIVSDSAPEVAFKPGHVEVRGHVHMLLLWDGDGSQPFLAYEAPFEGKAKMQVTEGANEVVHLGVEYVSCAPITVLDNHLGPDMAHLEELVDEVAQSTLIPYLNSVVQKGVVLPNSHGMHLEHSKLELGDGDLRATSDIAIDMDAFKASAKGVFAR